MKKINSNLKGKVGERGWVKFCKKHGFNDVKRSVQYCGKVDPEAGDCIGLPYIHQEVKTRKTHSIRIYDFIEQSEHDAKGNDIPIVTFKGNRKKWLVIMDADDWFKLYECYLNYKNRNLTTKDKLTKLFIK